MSGKAVGRFETCVLVSLLSVSDFVSDDCASCLLQM